MSVSWDKLGSAGKGAVLAETSNEKETVALSAGYKRKVIRHPVSFEAAFDKAKTDGRITGTWAAYITEAIRVKLTEDGFL